MNPEQRINSAIDTLITGPVPDGLKCDISSLCKLAGVPRSTLYRSYPHLRTEFDRRRQRLEESGVQPDPRQAQIDRLKKEIETLRQRLSDRQREIDELAAFRATALSRLAAQHDEIERLRRNPAKPAGLTRLESPSLIPKTGVFGTPPK